MCRSACAPGPVSASGQSGGSPSGAGEGGVCEPRSGGVGDFARQMLARLLVFAQWHSMAGSIRVGGIKWQAAFNGRQASAGHRVVEDTRDAEVPELDHPLTCQENVLRYSAVRYSAVQCRERECGEARSRCRGRLPAGRGAHHVAASASRAAVSGVPARHGARHADSAVHAAERWAEGGAVGWGRGSTGPAT